MNKDDNIIPFAFKRFQERRKNDGMEIDPIQNSEAKQDIDPVSTKFRRETDPIEEIRAFTEARVMMAENRAQEAERKLIGRPELISVKEHAVYYMSILLCVLIIISLHIGVIMEVYE